MLRLVLLMLMQSGKRSDVLLLLDALVLRAIDAFFGVVPFGLRSIVDICIVASLVGGVSRHANAWVHSEMLSQQAAEGWEEYSACWMVFPRAWWVSLG